MAYYLQFDGVDDEVTFPDVLAGAATFTVNLDVNIKAAPLSFNSLLSNTNPGGGTTRNMIFTTSNRAMEVACIIGGVRRAFLTSNGIFSFNQRMMVQLQYDGATLVLRINGVVRGSIAATGVLNTTSSVGDKGFTRLGKNAALGFPNIDLYGLEFIGNGAVSRFYNPSASGGAGTILPDTSVNAINGTLVNFTVPAAWVFYDDGGATTSTISYDIGAIDFAVSAEPSAPAVSASVSYDIGEIAFAVSASSSVPVVGAIVGYDIGAIEFSVAASAFAPGTIATVSYDIGDVEFSVSASSSVPVFQSAIAYDIGEIEFNIQAAATAAGNFATIAYDIGAIDFNVSADSSVPVVSATASYDIGEVSFSIAAAASAPGSAATVSFDIGEIVFAVSASATGPVPQDISATIGYDIGAISFSVSATVTGIGPGSGVGYGVQFTEPPRGFIFTEPPRGFIFTEPPRGVQF